MTQTKWPPGNPARFSQYSQRARIEGQIGRWNQVIRPARRFHTGAAQATEVACAVEAFNRMLDLGRPEADRVA